MAEELVDDYITDEDARAITLKALKRSLAFLYHQIRLAADQQNFKLWLDDPSALTELHVNHLRSKGFEVWPTGAGFWKWMKHTGWLISWEKRNEAVENVQETV
jgi:hypothetical protein